MGTWGALNVDSRDAAREVLDHTVVATLAYVSARFRDSRDRLGIAWFAAVSSGDALADADPAAPLQWMARVERVLRDGGADPRWHGLGTFLWVMDGPDRYMLAQAAGRVVEASARQHSHVRSGVAHATEADDPADLLRLAAHRCGQAEDDGSGGTARPALATVKFPVSDGEQARLDLIAQNRDRSTEPLVREALDLLFARHGWS